MVVSAALLKGMTQRDSAKRERDQTSGGVPGTCP
jgi:hypothetical protein